MMMAEDWQPIETAPEDELVLLATSGDWVDTATCLVDESTGERRWFWQVDRPIHPNLKPFGWQRLPAGLSAPVLPQPCLSMAEKAAQAARCGCRGADDWCVCQNAPDRQTIAERRAAAAAPA